MLPKNRLVMHPGKMLLKGYLEPMGISQAEFSRKSGISAQAVNEFVHGRRRVSSKLAIILGDAFDTGPEFWVRLQADHDFSRDREEMKRRQELPERVKALNAVNAC